MKTKHITTIFAILYFLFTHSAFSQHLISGQVKDGESNEKMAFCTASIYSTNDSLITGTITNDKGFFEIPLNNGDYKLVLSYLGYFNDTLKFNHNSSSKFLGVIDMKRKATELQEVQVKSSTSEFNIDKEVQLVTAQMREGSINTADVLSRMKGLSYDRYNNTIKVDGDKNVVILVNGLEKNQEYIKNLPPERIKEVEIIRNPSGRYALEGYSAVINIVLKSDYRGTDFYLDNMSLINIRSEEKKYIPLNNSSVNFNYTREKTNFYIRAENYYTNLFLKYENSQLNNNTIRMENKAPDDKNNLMVDNLFNNLTFGADYYVNPKQTLSIENTISVFPISKEATTTKQDVSIYENNVLLDTYSASNKSEAFRGEYTGILYYTFKMDEKNHLKTDFTYSTYKNDYLSKTLQSNGFERNEDGLDKKEYIQLYAEYEHILNEKSSILIGYGNYWKQLENSFILKTSPFLGADWLADSTEFSITETRNKFYAYYSRKFGTKLSMKIGSASELTYFKTSSWNKTFFIAKPHFDFLINAHEMLAVKLKYRTEISYPNIGQVNPFQRFVDTYTFERGNEKLRPELSHIVSAQFKFLQGLLTLEPYYSFSDNYIARTVNPINDSIFEFSYDNVGNYAHKGLKGDLTIPLFKQSFIIQSGFDFFESSIKYNDKLNKVNDVRLNSQWIYIHKKTEAIAGLIFQKNMTKNINAQGYNYYDNDYWLFIAQKPFMKKKLSVMVGYMLPIDFLANYDQGSYTDAGYYKADSNADISVLKNLFMFKITYHFSKGKSVRELEKEINLENERKSGGFF